MEVYLQPSVADEGPLVAPPLHSIPLSGHHSASAESSFAYPIFAFLRMFAVELTTIACFLLGYLLFKTPLARRSVDRAQQALESLSGVNLKQKLLDLERPSPRGLVPDRAPTSDSAPAAADSAPLQQRQQLQQDEQRESANRPPTQSDVLAEGAAESSASVSVLLPSLLAEARAVLEAANYRRVFELFRSFREAYDGFGLESTVAAATAGNTSGAAAQDGVIAEAFELCAALVEAFVTAPAADIPPSLDLQKEVSALLALLQPSAQVQAQPKAPRSGALALSQTTSARVSSAIDTIFLRLIDSGNVQTALHLFEQLQSQLQLQQQQHVRAEADKDASVDANSDEASKQSLPDGHVFLSDGVYEHLILSLCHSGAFQRAFDCHLRMRRLTGHSEQPAILAELFVSAAQARRLDICGRLMAEVRDKCSDQQLERALLAWVTACDQADVMSDVRALAVSLPTASETLSHSESLLNRLLAAFIVRGDLDTSDIVADLMQRNGVRLDDTNAEAYLAVDCARHDVTRGRALFEDLIQRDGVTLSAETYQHVLSLFAYAKDPAAAMRAMEDMEHRGVPRTLLHYSTLMKAFAAVRDYDRALSVHDLVRRDGLEADSMMYGCLMNFAVEAHHLDKALHLYDDMKKVCQAEHAAASAAAESALQNASELHGEGASDASHEASQQQQQQQPAPHLPQLHPSMMNFMTLIRGCGREGRLRDAFQLFEEMKQFGLQPDDVVYNCLLDACVASREIERAVALFEEFKHNSSVKPDEISYNTMIKACAQARMTRRAFDYLEEMKHADLAPNDVTYNTLIDACVRSSDMERAWQLLEDMHKRGIHPDNFTYSTLIKGIGHRHDAEHAGPGSHGHGYGGSSQRFGPQRGGYGNNNAAASASPESQGRAGAAGKSELDRAFEMLDAMKRDHIQPDEVLFNCLIDACVRFGDHKRALSVFDEMRAARVEPSAVTYGILIKSFGQSNMLNKAFSVFREMKSRGLKPNDVTYGCLLDACVRNGDVDQAVNVFRSMQEDGVKGNTILYTTLIKGFCKTRQLSRALEVYESMKNNPDIKPNNVTYNSLLDACVRAEDMDKAWQIFLELRQSQITPDLITFSTLIKGYCRSNHIDRAFEVLDMMKKEGIAPDEILFNSLLDGCARTGDVELALQLFEDMRGMRIRPSNVTYSILIKVYGRARQLNKALEVLEDMKRDGITPGKVVYTCLIQTCIRARQLNRALEIYRDMERNNVQGDHVTFNTLVSGCLQAPGGGGGGARQLDTALRLVDAAFAQDVELAPDVYNHVLDECVHQRRMDEAGKVCQAMKRRNLQPDLRLYSKIVKSLMRDMS